MVHTRGRELHGQRHTRPLAELVAVDPQAETCVAGRRQDATGLVFGESAALAEDVCPADVREDGVEHGTADQVRVLLRVRTGGDQVRAEVRDLVDLGRGDPGAAGFVVHVQPVARLALQVGGPLGDCLFDPVPHEAAEFVVADAARSSRGHGDAARAVALPGHAGLELGGAVPREDKMGMRIDPARQDGAAFGVDFFIGGRSVLAGPDPGNPFAFKDDGRIREDPVLQVLGHQLADVGNECAGWCGSAHMPIVQRRTDQRVAASCSAVRDSGLSASTVPRMRAAASSAMAEDVWKP